jgi:hypothetical protein
MNREERRAARRAGCGGEYEPVTPFARVMRPQCSECSGPVQWMSLGEAGSVLGIGTVNRFFSEASEAIGYQLDAGDLVDFWRCRSCDNSGALSPLIEG